MTNNPTTEQFLQLKEYSSNLVLHLHKTEGHSLTIGSFKTQAEIALRVIFQAQSFFQALFYYL